MYKPIDKDEVLRLVKDKGPVIPNHIRKELRSDTIMVGAVLSQLIEEGKVKITSVKIGGSPNYYAPGSEEKLASLVRFLNEKDRRVAELLQENKVLKDSDQDPLVRVALRNIKDFAKPLEVNIKGSKEIYWKWFLISTKEAEDLISGRLKPSPKLVKQVVKPLPKSRPALGVDSEIENTEAKKAQRQQRLAASALGGQQSLDGQDSSLQESPSFKRHEHHAKLPKPSSILDEEKDEFFTSVREYLEDKGIAILDFKIIKKSEIDLFLLVPTGIGVQEYYCKAKKKKKVGEGDLSSAYLQGQQSRLPIVFLSTGELSKKTKEALASQFKGLIFKKM